MCIDSLGKILIIDAVEKKGFNLQFGSEGEGVLILFLTERIHT